jgi:hypothetical protein
MKNLTDFQGFLIKEGLFNFKENKLKREIEDILTRKDHTEMFFFITAHKDLIESLGYGNDDFKNLSSNEMVGMLNDLLEINW